jgi:hypothetical protein
MKTTGPPGNLSDAVRRSGANFHDCHGLDLLPEEINLRASNLALASVVQMTKHCREHISRIVIKT